MKITAPLSSASEIDMLLHCGADEIYCGIHPPDWQKHFGSLNWINRRAPFGANLTSIQDVRQVTDAAHAAGTSVHITLNAPFYTSESIDYVKDLAFDLVAIAGIDSVIVNDLNLLLRLNEENFSGRIHLSSLGGCINLWTVAFYASLNIKRIILPRQMQYREIERIVREGRKTGMEFEVFAVNDGCYFEEAHCQTTHGAGGPFCLEKTGFEPIINGGNGISAAGLARHQKQYEEYLWYQNNCGSSFQEDGFPNGPCSLCGFGRFRDWGVTAVKIIGREASFFRKMRSLMLVKAVMDEVRKGTSADAVAEFSKRIRNTPDYCEKGYMCYFRGN
jgi:U32 family peptidase